VGLPCVRVFGCPVRRCVAVFSLPVCSGVCSCGLRSSLWNPGAIFSPTIPRRQELVGALAWDPRHAGTLADGRCGDVGLISFRCGSPKLGITDIIDWVSFLLHACFLFSPLTIFLVVDFSTPKNCLRCCHLSLGHAPSSRSTTCPSIGYIKRISSRSVHFVCWSAPFFVVFTLDGDTRRLLMLEARLFCGIHHNRLTSVRLKSTGMSYLRSARPASKTFSCLLGPGRTYTVLC